MANIRTGRKSGFIMRSGGRVRETIWFGGTAFRNAVATTGVALVQSLNAAALALRPFTIVRTRGILWVSSDQEAATEDYGASYGEAVVSDQANSVGVTAVPTPTTESASDLWFVYEFLLGRFAFGSTASFADVGNGRIIDSKAMRKVEDGQDIVAVVEGPGAGITSTGTQIMGFTRKLVKLH